MNDEHQSIERTVIIGLDASEQSRDALALGRLLAETLKATPLVATVLPYPPEFLTAEELTRAVGFDTEALFGVAQEKLAPLDSRTRAIVAPSAAKGLYQLAEEQSAIATVVGSTHRGPLGRVLPGSVGVNLLQGAPRAVAVPRADTPPPTSTACTNSWWGSTARPRRRPLWIRPPVWRRALRAP